MSVHRFSIMKNIIVIAFSFVTTGLFAQKDLRPPLLDLDAIQVQFLLNSDNYQKWDAEEYGLHTIKGNLDEIGDPSGILSVASSQRSTSGLYRVNLCFTPLNRKTGAPNYTKELKMGFSFYRSISNFISYYAVEQGTADTTYSINYNYLFETDELSFDAAWLFKTNPENGIAVFTGIGAGAGSAVSSNIKAIYARLYNVTMYDTTCNCNSGVVEAITADEKAKQPFYFNAYVPFGIEFRVINRWRVTLEGDAGVSWQVFVNASNALRFQYAAGLGLKYFW